MSLKIPAPFPIFPASAPPAVRPATELRLSRWNNANAQPFIRRRREQQEIEDDIRRHRRHHSAAQIADSHEPPTPTSPPSASSFKSRGTPSSPSSPSIPGRVSKYSKPPKKPNLPSHPAFRRSPIPAPPAPGADAGISIGDHGVSYRVKDAPFEFQYSYTETPKVRPLALREPPFLPFGPATMPRPWTGRAPLPKSKKKLPEFDSFKLPPHGKKGVKPVQSPGPFLSGSGPKYATISREEILGEPLTEAEVKEMIKGCLKTTRQLNMGRDGLTHNMLDNIHSHWKRRRVCKIKCKGVCTVDMDNVRQQLEEKTGGKVIYHCGGVIYLFRGRNYNYRTRPRFPLMLWKPVTPVYPRLVQRVPEGLTWEEATEMRKKGHQLPPICKLGKNGLYSFIVKLVREAFEECELVRINCSGLNKSDCRKIGAKLKDLVPCVLLSFAYEHILIWRGTDWISSLPPLEDSPNEARELATDAPATTSTEHAGSLLMSPKILGLVAVNGLNEYNTEVPVENLPPVNDGSLEETNNPSGLETMAVTSPSKDPTKAIYDAADSSNIVCHEFLNTSLHETSSLVVKKAEEDLSLGTCQSIPLNEGLSSKESEDHSHRETEPQVLPASSVVTHKENSGEFLESDGTDNFEGSERLPKNSLDCQRSARSSPCLDGVMRLLKQAVENGSAAVLDDESLDANIVYERSVSLAKVAAPGPVFQQRIRKIVVKKMGKEKAQKYEDVDVEAVTVSGKRGNIRNNSRSQIKDGFRVLSDEVPRGSLGVDELAKLLA